jgi:hypothetical protein
MILTNDKCINYESNAFQFEIFTFALLLSNVLAYGLHISTKTSSVSLRLVTSQTLRLCESTSFRFTFYTYEYLNNTSV